MTNEDYDEGQEECTISRAVRDVADGDEALGVLASTRDAQEFGERFTEQILQDVDVKIENDIISIKAVIKKKQDRQLQILRLLRKLREEIEEFSRMGST